LTRTALIIGITGQDGAYLSRFLIDRGYRVHGTSRDVENRRLAGLERTGVIDDVVLHSAAPTEFRALSELVAQTEPDEIYNLAGQSSVALSFTQPQEAFNSIAMAQLQLVEVLRHLGASSRLFNACSSESYGRVARGVRLNESNRFEPVSPYGVAKASSYWTTASYRAAYGLYCCSGILFNHESPLRPERFVTRKILRTAMAISQGSSVRLELGNLDVWRDWGFAGDYVDAMWRMLQLDEPEDFVIATGTAHSLADFVERIFTRFGLDWRDHVVSDSALRRPTDIEYACGDPAQAKQVLDWSATTDFDALVDLLVESELAEPAVR